MGWQLVFAAPSETQEEPQPVQAGPLLPEHPRRPVTLKVQLEPKVPGGVDDEDDD